MQFNSYIFILLFLPLVFICYFVANKLNSLAGKIVLIIASIIFYMYGGLYISLILLASILVNGIINTCLEKVDRKRKSILVVSILINVGILIYYKYFDFLASNIESILENDYTARKVLLPLGISFFTFQQIMYTVNVYKGEITHVDLVDYLLYILYFPKLIMGPLAEPSFMLEKFNDSTAKKVDFDNVACGIKLFSFGLFKKAILADTFAVAVNWGFLNFDAVTSVEWICIMLFYTFEIYFDFSGYCDMALGVSKMLNIELPINFDSPYKAVSIRDFWKRWHISLTGFLTKYIYIPLGGNRKGNIRTYINTIIVFLISGIWHGANWTFILWGVLHGVCMVVDRLIKVPKKKIVDCFGWIVTFVTVNVLWLLFRSESIIQWIEALKKIIRFDNRNISDDLIQCFTLPETTFMFRLFHLTKFDSHIPGFSVLGFVALSFLIVLGFDNNYKQRDNNNFVLLIISIFVFVWSFLTLSGESVFVYFNF